MSDRVIPSADYDSETKKRILEEAIKLFALKGFSAVTIREIAKTVGIKMSSIYNYYESKDALLEEIFDHFERGYRHYFDWLTEENVKANTLEELMDNMFNREFLEMRDPIGCLCTSLLVKEQHNNLSARSRVFGLLFEHSIERLQADFDRLIEKGIIPPSDTKTLATLFMFSVMATNDIRIHERMGAKPPVDCMEVYSGLRNFFTFLLKQGVAPVSDYVNTK